MKESLSQYDKSSFCLEILLQTKLTVMSEFHSHLENMELLDPNTFGDQVSFGYELETNNVITIPGFSKDYDRTR